MAKRVRFVQNYDHRWWPTRSYTAFKAGWSGPVKDEVARAAVAAGRAVYTGKDRADGAGR